jgi:hypothetical protein
MTGQVSTPKAEENRGGVGLGLWCNCEATSALLVSQHFPFYFLGAAAVQPDYDYVTRPTGRGIENKRSALQEDLRRGCCWKYSLLLHRLVGCGYPFIFDPTDGGEFAVCTVFPGSMVVTLQILNLGNKTYRYRCAQRSESGMYIHGRYMCIPVYASLAHLGRSRMVICPLRMPVMLFLAKPWLSSQVSVAGTCTPSPPSS